MKVDWDSQASDEFTLIQVYQRISQIYNFYS